jgi:hypothetical protein
MGAALVLDCPSPGFVAKYFKKFISIPGGSTFPNLDDEGIKHATDAFERACMDRCLELASIATTKDPANPEWWRLRAILLWRNSIYSYDPVPRDPNWKQILEACAAHDPDNALYDYLAAFFCWESSAEQDYSGSVDQLVIKDRQGFDRGIENYRRGQAKAFFAVGDRGFMATATFLDHADVPRAEHPEIVNSRTIALRRSSLLRSVSRWQGRRAEEEIAAGNIKSGLAIHRQNLHLFDQFAGSDKSAEYDNVLSVCRKTTTAQMLAAVDAHQDSLTADVIQDVHSLNKSAEIDDAVLQNAAQILASGGRQTPAGKIAAGDLWNVALYVAVSTLASVAVALMLLGIAAAIVKRWIREVQHPRIQIAEHLLAITIAIAITVTAFGLAPAKVISQETQAWVLTTLVILTPVLLTTWAVGVWLHVRGFQYGLGTLFKSISAICILLALVSLVRPIAVSFAAFPFRLEMPALGWNGWNADVLEELTRPLGVWLWVVFQWTVYLGPYLTVAIWACLIATLLAFKFQFERRDAICVPPSFRDRVGALSWSLGRPSVMMGVIVVIAYLALAPFVLDYVERDYQAKMAYARRPDIHWTEVDQAVQNVRTDKVEMKEIEDSLGTGSPETPSDEAD